jgi:hypothetical protein
MSNLTRLCIQKLVDPPSEYVFTADSKVRAAFVKSKRWPVGSVLRIAFPSGRIDDIRWTPINVLQANGQKVDPIEDEIRKMNPTDAVKTVVRERIVPIAPGIKIEFVDNVEDANVRVGFDDSSGSWALVGTDQLKVDPPESTVNFGWLDSATIMHEFGHVLGMIHEHQNPNDNQIKWNRDAVIEWASRTQGWDAETTETNILNRYNENDINGSVFDPKSIMLYFFSADLTTNGVGTSQNLRLSSTDKYWIESSYQSSASGGGVVKKNVDYDEQSGSNMDSETWYKTPFGILIIIVGLLLLGVIVSLLVRMLRRIQ